MSADSFDELYAAIAEDLVTLARTSPNGEVVYAVPGSPLVAERTVELLRARDDVTTVTRARGLGDRRRRARPSVATRWARACAWSTRSARSTTFAVPDRSLCSRPTRPKSWPAWPIASLRGARSPCCTTSASPTRWSRCRRVDGWPTFVDADHLTSLWVEGFRDAGQRDGRPGRLIERLRHECPWDQEQTHGSLTRHLLEEAYEAFDALEAFVAPRRRAAPTTRCRPRRRGARRRAVPGPPSRRVGRRGGVLQPHLDRRRAARQADRRHPHVFGDVQVRDAADVRRVGSPSNATRRAARASPTASRGSCRH